MAAICLYVIDTGYLDELFAVDSFSTPEGQGAVKRKFAEAVANRARFHVPVPVLFELATHISRVKNIARRKELAAKLAATVKDSIAESNPWIISHHSGAETISDLMTALAKAASQFAEEIDRETFSLTDVVVLLEAERLRQKHLSTPLRPYRVHIWTRENAIKSREPDPEPDPFVG